MLREVAPQIEAGLDTHGLVNHAFYQYDVRSEVPGPSHSCGPNGHDTVDPEEEAGPDAFFDADLEFDDLHDDDDPGAVPYRQRVQELRDPLAHNGRSALDQTAHTLLFARARGFLIDGHIATTQSLSNPWLLECLYNRIVHYCGPQRPS